MEKLLAVFLSFFLLSCSPFSGKLSIAPKGSATLAKTIYPPGLAAIFSGSEGHLYMMTSSQMVELDPSKSSSLTEYLVAGITPTLQVTNEQKIKFEPDFAPMKWVHIGNDKFLLLIGDIGSPAESVPVIGAIDGLLYDGVEGTEVVQKRLVDLGKGVLIYADVRQSPDLRHYGMTLWTSGSGGGVQISTTFLDTALQTQSKRVEKEYPTLDPGTNLFDLLIPNQGGTILIHSTLSAVGSTLHLDYASESHEEITANIPFPTKLARKKVAVGGVTTAFSGEEELAVAAGLVDEDENLKGIYLTRINYTTGTIISHDSLLLDYPKARELTEKANMPHILPRKIMFSEDGTIYVVAEGLEMKKVNTTAYEMTDDEGIVDKTIYQVKRKGEDYYESVLGDLILFSFSSEGKYQWGERIIENDEGWFYIQAAVWEASPHRQMHYALQDYGASVTLRRGKFVAVYNKDQDLRYAELPLESEVREVKDYELVKSSGIGFANQSGVFWQNDSTLLVSGFTGLFPTTYYLMQVVIP